MKSHKISKSTKISWNLTKFSIHIGWTQDTEELTEVSIMPTDNNICEEISEVSPNTLCTEEKTAPGIPCSGEEFAGAPLMCQKNNEQWYLVGILAWRKGCSTVGKKYNY